MTQQQYEPTNRRADDGRATARAGYAIHAIYHHQRGQIYNGGFVGPRNGLLRGRRGTDERVINHQCDTTRDILIFADRADAVKFCEDNYDQPAWAYAPTEYKVRKYTKRGKGNE